MDEYKKENIQDTMEYVMFADEIFLFIVRRKSGRIK